MIRSRPWVCAGVLLIVSGIAWGDGKFFSKWNDVSEPNQKALLWLDGGRETLILQVKYQGKADEFGWVLPVPSRPEMSEAAAGLFYELAWVTRPPAPTDGMKGRGARAGGMGGAQGVIEIEHAQVGPYDATVLAATDPNALANWLRQHGYQMPQGAERVLQSYVEKGWYYVAMRVDVKRLRADLLRALQTVDPGLKGLDQAPERLATKLLRTLDSQGAKGRGMTARLDRALEEWARQGETEGPHESIWYTSSVASAYDRAAAVMEETVEQWPYRVESGPYLSCLESCEQSLSKEKLQAAARQAGLVGQRGLEGLELRIYESINRDVQAGVPYAKSQIGRFQAALLKASPSGDLPGNLLSEADYNQLLDLLAKSKALPPPSQEEVTEIERSRGADPMVSRLRGRAEVYEETVAAVRNAVGMVEAQLSAGTIRPIRFDFDSRGLVYPLRISSLGKGATDIQLYVLAHHRMTGKGFNTTFAAKLGDRDLQGAPTLKEYVTEDRDRLTELRATMKPEQMTADVTLVRAESDEPVQAAPDERGPGPGAAGTRGGRRSGARGAAIRQDWDSRPAQVGRRWPVEAAWLALAVVGGALAGAVVVARKRTKTAA